MDYTYNIFHMWRWQMS